MEHLDVLIVGAGLSGIGAAYYIQHHFPRKTYALLEARDAIGGTWDLFRYPGVRSDSDMYTLGYRFRPWQDPKAIADGPAILSYIRETAAEYNIDQHIRFGHKMCSASWSSADSLWTVEAQTAQGIITLTCRFLYMCTGYYDYDDGYTPAWDDIERFEGQIIHPQKWPQTLDYADKQVIVVGSGATAVTLVPAMTDQAAHVTMLQRSPSYIFSMPAEDGLTNTLRRFLPERVSYLFARWKAILLTMFSYIMSRRFPQTTKRNLIKLVRQELGAGYDVETHFTPHYNPWDQRLCLVPDSDLFKAIKSGKASVVTDHIEGFTPDGVRLRSGQVLPADIIVTATGLVMRLMKGIDIRIDGESVTLSKLIAYKGMMFSDVPNMALAFGYTNASWTLKCELTSEYVCRLLKYMDKHGYTQCIPRRDDPSIQDEPAVNFTSGYVQRALAELPGQGSKKPWKVHQNYILDLMTMRFGRLDDGTMAFR